ncbi:hypothetical protein HMPREF1624_06285 [Sporothrix schenckii ATCC 58251]|uniref:Uncharacterized protein n=1 Tax=Sporothrix schenckii (strain ATCC 58251 / de Perez 2211183) TaxID=1391915 RepID=U7PMW7_SPOS1|nr:hypothetical protein HMPREF1624_06285 [Sporothrix schenckii ATCC 58251]
MGIFSFKRGSDKKKKGKAKEEDVEVEKDIFNQAFLGDDPYMRGKGTTTQIYAGTEFFPERAATPLSRPDSQQNSPTGAHGIFSKKLSGGAFHAPSRPWTSGNGAPQQRTGSFSGMSGPESSGNDDGFFSSSRLPLDSDVRPSTSHGPGSKPWAHSHSFSAQFGPAAGNRPQTPQGRAAAGPSNAAASTDVRSGTNSPTRSGLHNSQSLSDNNMSTSSSAPTDTDATESSVQGSSNDERRAASPPSTVSNQSPPSMSPEPVWPLQSSKKSSADGMASGGMLNQSTSFGDEAQLAINEAANRATPPQSDILVPPPLSTRSRDVTPTGPGYQEARVRKAKDAAMQRDLAIEVPKRRSWGAQIDQLEKSWTGEQQSPGGSRLPPRHNGPQHPQSAPYYQQHHHIYDQRPNHPHQFPPSQRTHQNDRPYDPRHDPRYDPRQDPRYDQRYRTESNYDTRRQQQPYSPGYGPRSQSSQGHYTNGLDSRDRYYSNSNDSSPYAMGRFDRQLSSSSMPRPPTRPASAGRDGPRRIGSDFDLQQGRIPYGNPPKALRSTKSMQQLPRSPRDYPNMRNPSSPQGHPPYLPRGGSMTPNQFRSPPPSMRSPPGNMRSPPYTIPHSSSGGDVGPRYASNGPVPRTRAPQPMGGDSGPSYRDPSQYGPLRSPLGSPPHLPNSYPEHAGAYPASRSGQYPVVENPVAYQPLDQPVAGGYQSFGPPLSGGERRNLPPIAGAMRLPNSPLSEGPSAADRQLPDVAEVVEERPASSVGTEVKDFAIQEEPETVSYPTGTTPTTATATKTTVLAQPTSSPPRGNLDLPQSQSTGSLDMATLNSFPLPSRDVSQIPPLHPQSPTTASPVTTRALTPSSPTGAREQGSGLTVLNKTKDILATTSLFKEPTATPEVAPLEEVATPTATSPISVKSSPVTQKAMARPVSSVEMGDTPPETPTKESSDTKSDFTDADEEVEEKPSRVSTLVVAKQETFSHPQTPESMKLAREDTKHSQDDDFVDAQEMVREARFGQENQTDRKIQETRQNQEDNNKVVQTEVQRPSLDSEPPLSPISLPAGDPEPSPTANWPLPSVFVLPPDETAEDAPQGAPEDAAKDAPEKAPENIVEQVVEAPVAAESTITTPATPVTPATPNSVSNHGDDDDAERDEDELFPDVKASPTTSKSAFTASVYARDIGLGPYAFDGADSLQNLPTDAPWVRPNRLDSLEKAPQQKLVPNPEPEPAATSTSVEMPPDVPPAVPPKDVPQTPAAAVNTTPEKRMVGAYPETPAAVEDKHNDDPLAKQVASPESRYSWGGDDTTGGVNENESNNHLRPDEKDQTGEDNEKDKDEDEDGLGPLPPGPIGVARGPSTLSTDDPLSSPKGNKRWNIASHLNNVDGDALHERIIGVGGGVGNGASAIKGEGPPKLPLGHLTFDRHTPTDKVDSFGTTFI